jgi:hypothetical protein
VYHLRQFFLYFDVKAGFAARADNGVLSFLFWEAKVVFAGGAFFINMSLSVAQFAFL